MAKLDILRIEIELRMYQIKPTNKKWWEFWKPKERRVLLENDYDDIEKTT